MLTLSTCQTSHLIAITFKGGVISVQITLSHSEPTLTATTKLSKGSISNDMTTIASDFSDSRSALG